MTHHTFANGTFANDLFTIEILGHENALWRYTVHSSGRAVDVAAPAFEIDGALVPAALDGIHPVGDPRALSNGAVEHTYRGAMRALPDLALDMVFRIAKDNPTLRFQYCLNPADQASTPHTLTKTTGEDRLHYLSLSLSGLDRCREIRLSEFDESVHSFHPTERDLPPRAFAHQLAAMGPLLVAGDDTHALLVAYEHGSQVPDAFVHYRLGRDRRVVLCAVKGNYYDGRPLTPAAPYETIWLQLACIGPGSAPGSAGHQPGLGTPPESAPGSAEHQLGLFLAQHYRRFVLHHMTLNAESRQPYIFYNTWNYQERNKWWNGKTFLDSMHQERILAEIDVAQRMGIEVFVIDTGWYQKTGDWQVDTARFPGGLRVVKERLDGYGMKLGLWFSPTQAAVSSRMLQDRPECRMSWDGQVGEPRPVWETEASQRMCLVSPYWRAFADELIRLYHEIGVTYFKWDAVGQYGCNDPHHLHGTAANSPRERADCYAFEVGRYMARVVDRVCQACPEAIVDFDVTEGHRYVGLGFLAAGKYYLINNGPYYRSLDDPRYAPGGGMGSNVFVFPGPARARVCRTPLDYDRWIPSVLWMTHYLPDDPRSSQLINLASLVLGQNGIWGDLLEVSDQGVALFGRVLGLYKQVRRDVTASYPVREGIVGGSPEIHEKILAETGRGLVAVFAAAPGRYTYVTAHPVAGTHWCSEGMQISRDETTGQARIEVALDRPGAALAFFGVTPEHT